MNKRKSILELARKSNSKANKDDKLYRQLVTVVEILSHYFKIYDMDNGTIHSKVFSMLYLSEKYYTYRIICDKLSVSKNTLIRYIDKYEKLALKVIEKLKL